MEAEKSMILRGRDKLEEEGEEEEEEGVDGVDGKEMSMTLNMVMGFKAGGGRQKKKVRAARITTGANLKSHQSICAYSAYPEPLCITMTSG